MLTNQYKAKRDLYKNVVWLSNGGKKTLISNIEDDYLLNILRKVNEKLTLAERYPQVNEFQEYEGVTYKKWSSYLYNEYLYRKEEDEIIMAKEDLEIEYEYQLKTERDDYMYDLGAYGECF
jgi:hypothetical protein